MRYRRLAAVEKDVSEIGIMPASLLGLDRLGHDFDTQVSDTQACCADARRAGINYFEVSVAGSVAATLETFGDATKAYRDEIVVGGHLLPRHLTFVEYAGQRAGVWEESMRIAGRLGYDYLDVLWVPPECFDDAVMVADLRRLIAGNIVRALGVEPPSAGWRPAPGIADLPLLRRRALARVSSAHDSETVCYARLHGTAMVSGAVLAAERAMTGDDPGVVDDAAVRSAIDEGECALVVLAARDAGDVARLARVTAGDGAMLRAD